jgi:predicted transcriptional regulator
MLSSAKESMMAQKGGSLRTPAAIQARVIAGCLAGKSKSQVHRETGLSRATIRRILSQSEVEAILASYRDQVRDLVPNAIKVCARNLRGKRASWKLAIEILKGTQVFVASQKQEQHHMVDEIETLTDDELRAHVQAILSGKSPLLSPIEPRLE